MVTRFSTPAHINDLHSDAAKRGWSDIVHDWFAQAEQRLPAGHRFFNVVDTPAPGGAEASASPPLRAPAGDRTQEFARISDGNWGGTKIAPRGIL
jgi:hypothetical protein